MLTNHLNLSLRSQQNKRSAYLLMLVLLVLTSCANSVLQSALTVQPGRQFQLGGNQRGAFTVQATNKGGVPVTLSERRADGQTVALGTFGAGDRQTIRFAAGSAVLIDNRSAQPAQLNLTVTGDKGNLIMREKIP